MSKPCHDWPNRDTDDAYDSRYDEPYPENVSSMPKIVSRLLKILSRFASRKTPCSQPGKSCHNFALPHNHIFESHCNSCRNQDFALGRKRREKSKIVKSHPKSKDFTQLVL